MIMVFSGVVLLAVSIAFLMYCRPRDGQTVRITTLPLLETIIPLTITSGLAMGAALIAAGVLF